MLYYIIFNLNKTNKNRIRRKWNRYLLLYYNSIVYLVACLYILDRLFVVGLYPTFLSISIVEMMMSHSVLYLSIMVCIYYIIYIEKLYLLLLL